MGQGRNDDYVGEGLITDNSSGVSSIEWSGRMWSPINGYLVVHYVIGSTSLSHNECKMIKNKGTHLKPGKIRTIHEVCLLKYN